jgi:hypothetical protein
MRFLSTIPGGISVISVDELRVPGERERLYTRVRRGELVPIFRGSYVRASAWDRLDEDARYRAKVEAAIQRTDGRHLVSHESAAALWRLPTLAAWPDRVHVIQTPDSGTRSTALFERHSYEHVSDPSEIDGVKLTSLARTVVDIAALRSFATSTVFADAALRRTTHPVPGIPAAPLDRAALLRELALVPLRQGTARARAVILFADAAADRPGESASRVSMHLAELPAPILQQALRGASGRQYFVDFWWPSHNLIGEFDGKGKYRDPEFLGGRSPEQALLDEKGREDDLRAAGYAMRRWGWDLANSPMRLSAHLGSAGLR